MSQIVDVVFVSRLFLVEQNNALLLIRHICDTPPMHKSSQPHTQKKFFEVEIF